MSRGFTKLGDLVKISKGKKANNITRELEAGLKRFIQIDDLRNDNNLKYTSDDGVVVQENDIIIAWDGANAGTIGYGLNGIIGSTLAALTFKTDQIDSEYLGRFLQNKSEYLRSKCTGATIPHISKDILLNLSVPIVPIEEQHRIVRILDQAQSLIEKRKQAIAYLDDYIKAVFLDMFGDPVKNEKDWPTQKLGNLCEIRRGASPRPIDNYIGTDIPWIKIGDATKGDDIYISKTKVKIKKEGASKSVLVNEGDLIFANCGVSLGFARIMKIEGCIHDGWLVFYRMSPQINKIFLLKLINHLTNYFQNIAPDGTQPNLNTAIMKNFSVILPEIEKQVEFSKTVIYCQSLNQKMQTQLKELEENFQAELQRAFRRSNVQET